LGNNISMAGDAQAADGSPGLRRFMQIHRKVSGLLSYVPLNVERADNAARITVHTMAFERAKKDVARVCVARTRSHVMGVV
jgi:hypothetical protein